MKLYAFTEEETNIIIQLCDIALKSGGLQSKPLVDKILQAIGQNNEGIRKPPQELK